MTDNTISLNIKHLSHNTYNLKLPTSATILELKQKIEEQSQIKPQEIKLIFKGKILKKDDETLEDLKIQDGSTFHMVHNKPQTETETQNTFPSQQNQQNTQQNQGQQNTPPPNPFQNMGMPGMGMPGMGMPGMGMPGMGMPGMGNMDTAQMQQMMQNPQMRAMAQNLLSNPEALRNMIQTNPMLSQMAQNNPQLQTLLDNPDQLRNISNMMFGQGTNPQGQQPGQTQPQQGQTQPNQPGQQTQQGQMPQMPMFNPAMFQNMQMPGNVGQQPQGNQNYEELYKDQLKKLEEMGFSNKQANIDILKSCYGNVDLAIEKLLGG